MNGGRLGQPCWDHGANKNKESLAQGWKYRHPRSSVWENETHITREQAGWWVPQPCRGRHTLCNPTVGMGDRNKQSTVPASTKREEKWQNESPNCRAETCHSLLSTPHKDALCSCLWLECLPAGFAEALSLHGDCVLAEKLRLSCTY